MSFKFYAEWFWCENTNSAIDDVSNLAKLHIFGEYNLFLYDRSLSLNILLVASLRDLNIKNKMAENVDTEAGSDSNIVTKFVSELISSPLNLALLAVCGFLLYKIIMGQKKQEPLPPREPELEKMKKQDMTLEQLREYDGKGPDGRILLAANGKVFDVTRGKRFYGPGKTCISCCVALLSFECITKMYPK